MRRATPRVFALTAFAALLGGCDQNDATAYPPTLIQLIVNGHLYDGERVMVQGYITLGAEGRGDHLYLYCEDLLNQNTGHGLFLRLDGFELTPEREQELNRRYVYVIGEFEHPVALNNLEVIDFVPQPSARPICAAE